MEKSCEGCGSKFHVYPYRADKARFCSSACRVESTRKRRACEKCGSNISRPTKGRPFCSRACAAAARRSGREKACEWCEKSFYVPPKRTSKARFCSRACLNDWQGRGKTRHVCKLCEGEFRLSPSFVAMRTPKYCSVACRDADPDHRTRLLEMNTLQQAGRVTRAEAAGYALLDELGVEHERQQTFKGKFTPDAIVPAARLVVQFDGDYWHDRKGTSTEARILRRVALDRSQDAYIRACGWQVLRLWESDLHSNPEGCAAKIAAALREAATA